jgi:protein TonB
MFANSVGVQDGSSRFFRLTVGVSVLLHVAAGVTLIVASFWKIARLTPHHQELVFLDQGPIDNSPPPPAAEPPRPEPPQKTNPREGDPAAPRAIKPAESSTTDRPDTPPEKLPSGPSQESNSQETTDDPGTPFGPPGSGPGRKVGEFDPSAMPPPPPDPPAPAQVEQRMLEGQRIAGTREIQLPDSVLSSLRSSGTTKLRVSTQLCIDEAGRAASIRVSGSAGYELVESTIRNAMEQWRYRPWVVNGKTMRACVNVTFNYSITP